MKLILVGLLLVAAPAWAQRDAMKIDEKLNVAVVKKSESKPVAPAKSAAPDQIKGRESLEIETRREVKK